MLIFFENIIFKYSEFFFMGKKNNFTMEDIKKRSEIQNTELPAIDKCPECKENTLKTDVTDWGGLTQYVYRHCLNCGFEEKRIKSLY